MAAFSGFYESHESLPMGDARGILPPHRNDHRNGHQVGTYYIFVLFAVALAAARAIRSK